VVGIFKGQDIHQSKISNSKGLFVVVLSSQSNQYHRILSGGAEAGRQTGLRLPVC
jgi:hypothetical protein